MRDGVHFHYALITPIQELSQLQCRPRDEQSERNRGIHAQRVTKNLGWKSTVRTALLLLQLHLQHRQRMPVPRLQLADGWSERHRSNDVFTVIMDVNVDIKLYHHLQ